MSHLEFVAELDVDTRVEELFSWHQRAGAFERLQPTWETMRMLTPAAPLGEGDQPSFQIRIGPFWKTWTASIQNIVPGAGFEDVQIRGPFRSWHHKHQMTPRSDRTSTLKDHVVFQLPVPILSHWLVGSFVRQATRRLFAYRHRVTRDDLEFWKMYGGQKAMKVLVSGARGLLGKTLCAMLTTGGHQVIELARQPRDGARVWDPMAETLDPALFSGVDAVIHLAGENIASGRWTAARKAKIRESRVRGTRLLAKTLASLPSPPKVFVSASAIGFYGTRGDEMLDETASPGTDFLADVCREWEAALEPAKQAGLRTVAARFGVILSPAGGALQKMLLPFKMGAGGRLGDGRQWMSWIAIDDAAAALIHTLLTPSLNGPMLVVAPNPLRNAEYTRTLGQVLNRPTIFPMPAFAARLAFGEMADQLLLASQRCQPVKLLHSGYKFRYDQLEGALRHVLGRTG